MISQSPCHHFANDIYCEPDLKVEKFFNTILNPIKPAQNMAKKAPSCIFLFFTIIALLVHAVIPHHHHPGSVCVDEDHAQNSQHDDCSLNSDHPDDDETMNLCFLQEVQIQRLSANQHLTNHLSSAKNKTASWFHASLPDLFQHATLTSSSIFYTPSPALHSAHFSKSVGLRAPPLA